MVIKMKKMRYVVISLVLVVVLALTGCGGHTETPSGGSEATSSGTAEETITLKIMSGLQMEKEAPLEQALAEASMAENSNVKIEFIPEKVNDIPQRLIAMSTSGDLPDAFPVSTQFMAQASDMGLYVDPAPYMGEEFMNDLDPAVVEAASVDGVLANVPWTCQPHILIYRTDWLEEAGMDSIETMEDFRNAALAFTDAEKGQYGFALIGHPVSGQGRFKQFVNSFGLDEIYEEDGVWKSDLNTPEYREVLEFFTNLDLVDGVVGPGSTETDYSAACTLMAQERAGMMFSGSNAVGVILAENPDLKDKLGTCVTPKQERHCTDLAVGGYAISSTCKHPEVLADYLRFIAKPENSIDFAYKTGRLPVTTTALNDPAFEEPVYKGCVDAIKYSILKPNIASYNETWDIMGESYNSVLSGVSLDDAMKQVDKRVTALLEEANKG